MTGTSWERHDLTRRSSSDTARLVPLATLSRAMDINPKTVAKWRQRTTVEDLKKEL